MNEKNKKTEPYIQSDLAVNFDKELKRNDVLVYQALKRYMDRETLITLARIDTLATLIDRSESTVHRGLRALIARGVIIRIPRFSPYDGHQLCNAFYILGGAAPCYQTGVPKIPTLDAKDTNPINIDFYSNRFLDNSIEGSQTPLNCRNNKNVHEDVPEVQDILSYEKTRKGFSTD